MTPEDAARLDRLALEALDAGDLELAKALRAAARAYLRARELTHTNQPATVVGEVRDAAAAQDQGPPAKPPTLRDLAKWLGCTHGFLSQCKSGTSRIRKSWADKIASVRPDMPATLGKKGTWKATSWADEPSEG